MITWVVKLRDSAGRECYKYARCQPAPADYRALESDGYTVMGAGSIRVTEKLR